MKALTFLPKMAAPASAPAQRVSPPVRTLADNRPQAAAQRQLQAGINKSGPQGAIAQRVLIIGTGKNKITYPALPKVPTADAALALKEAIKGYTGEVPQVYERLRNLSRDITKTYRYATRDAAIRAAIGKVKAEQEGAKMHYPEPPMSPLRDDETALLTYLQGAGRTAEHMKPNAHWNELKINGQLGERGHQLSLAAASTPFQDANAYIGYNAPGVDTLSKEDGRCFGQSKMHMADGSDVADIAWQYLRHIDNAATYSKTFLKRILTDSPKSAAARAKLIALAKEWDNDTLNELVAYFDEEEYIGTPGELEEMLDDAIGSDGSAEQQEIVALVSGAMHFPVPSDVFDYIATHYAAHSGYFTRLGKSLYSFRKVKAQMEYKFNKPKRSEEENDGDYQND